MTSFVVLRVCFLLLALLLVPPASCLFPDPFEVEFAVLLFPLVTDSVAVVADGAEFMIGEMEDGLGVDDV